VLQRSLRPFLASRLNDKMADSSSSGNSSGWKVGLGVAAAAVVGGVAYYFYKAHQEYDEETKVGCADVADRS